MSNRNVRNGKLKLSGCPIFVCSHAAWQMTTDCLVRNLPEFTQTFLKIKI